MVSNYKGPRATGSRLFCEYCSKQFTKASTLQMHINISHLKMKPFPCEQCGKQFSKKHEVTEHVLTHHGEYLFFAKTSSLGTNKQDLWPNTPPNKVEIV